MKLIKINTDHYVVVDDLEIINGDWYYDSNDVESLIPIYQKSQQFADYSGCKKITHSTRPFGGNATAISLHEIKQLIGKVDMAEIAYLKHLESSNQDKDWIGYEKGIDGVSKEKWKKIYNQALEDNKEKKYTEEDLRRAFFNGGNMKEIEEFNSFIQSIQPKTSWEVEIIDSKLKLKC